MLNGVVLSKSPKSIFLKEFPDAKLDIFEMISKQLSGSTFSYVFSFINYILT
jgi:hypothetical protein